MAATALALWIALLAAVAAPPSGETSLELERLNRTYSDLAGELAPLQLDPVTIQLASPHQTIVVRHNRVALLPLGKGRFEGHAEIELLGKGDLIADIALGAGTPQHLTDELVLPQQKLSIDGQVRIARVAGGYEITTEQLPAEIRVEIRSRLVGDVLQACAGMALLTLGALDCDRATDALERPSLPLPPPGTRYLLGDADLTPADRACFDALLAAP